MEENNIFLKAALTKNVEIPPIFETFGRCSRTESFDNKEPATKSKDANAVAKERKIRSSPVKKSLIMEGLRRYGRDFKATVRFLIKHCDVLDENLKKYYESVGKPGGASIKKAVERARRLEQKTDMHMASTR